MSQPHRLVRETLEELEKLPNQGELTAVREKVLQLSELIDRQSAIAGRRAAPAYFPPLVHWRWPYMDEASKDAQK